MADPYGFLKSTRGEARTRPVPVRIQDWREVYEHPEPAFVEQQASRCMDCGVPFCHNGCPLGNLIPEWNDLVRQGEWHAASERLHVTNNFPDFTGRLCPAPCEAACVLSIAPDVTTGAVTIKKIEQEIADRAFAEGWLPPQSPAHLTGRSVAVVGSGPAGLAAAQQLTRVGHSVVVYERADRIGGLLRYGIPEFKMEKAVLDRRLDQMLAEGTVFRPDVEVGVDVSVAQLRADHDAIVLAVGATVPRDLPVPGCGLDGVYQAMEFLPLANRVCAGDLAASPIDAHGKDVVIIGGGDTGADCLGTVHRQGAASVVQLEIMPQPPTVPAASTPWPTWPLMLRTTPAHEEGGERAFAVSTVEFLGDRAGGLRALRLVEVRAVEGRFDPVEGTERELPCQLALLALGFTGPEAELAERFGLGLSARGTIMRDAQFATAEPGVFVAGDAGRGQSLIVWAIAEGRSAAAAADAYLLGLSVLPAAIEATDRALA